MTFVKGNSKREPLGHSIHDEVVANFNWFFWKHASFTSGDTGSGGDVPFFIEQLHTNPPKIGPVCPFDSFEHPSQHSSQLHDTLDEHFLHVDVLQVGSATHVGREVDTFDTSSFRGASFLHRRQEYPPLWFALMDHATSCIDPALHTTGSSRGSEAPSCPNTAPGGTSAPVPSIPLP